MCTLELTNYINNILNNNNILCPLRRAALLAPNQIAISNNNIKISYQELDHIVSLATQYIKENFINIGYQVYKKQSTTDSKDIHNYENSSLNIKIFTIIATPTVSYIITVLALMRLNVSFIPLSTSVDISKINDLKEFNICHIEHEKIFNEDFYKQIIYKLSTSNPHNNKQNLCLKSHIFLNHSHPFAIIETSGSTGSPKKITHTLKSILLNAIGANELFPLKEGDKYFLSLPLNHVGGQSIIFKSLIALSEIVLPEKQPQRLLNQIEQQLLKDNINKLSLVPTQLKSLFENPKVPFEKALNLNAIILGGAPMPYELLEKFLKKFPNIKIYTSYGMTETASQVITCRYSLTNNEWKKHPFIDIKIVHEEIFLKGNVIALGKLENHKITPITDELGYLHTSDLGKYENNILEIYGRKDNIFISGGENISPEFIENEIKKYNLVEDIVIVPIPDEYWGNICCAIVKTNKNLSELKNEFSSYLPKIFVPKIYLNWPQDFPITLKIQRKKFKEYAISKLNCA